MSTYQWAEPGTVDTATCNLCGADCAIQRNVFGPTGLASAMGDKKTLHDAFRCPHNRDDWHRRAWDIKVAMVGMPSPRVRNLMEQDLAELLQAYRPNTSPIP